MEVIWGVGCSCVGKLSVICLSRHLSVVFHPQSTIRDYIAQELHKSDQTHISPVLHDDYSDRNVQVQNRNVDNIAPILQESKCPPGTVLHVDLIHP